MAADRHGRTGPDTVTEQAKDMTARAQRRGGEAGRLRLRHLEAILVVAVQCGLAAALSWVIAHELLDRPAPVFAPSAAPASRRAETSTSMTCPYWSTARYT